MSHTAIIDERDAASDVRDAQLWPSGRALVEEIMERWRHGEPVDAREALDRHPELASNKSFVLDLVQEEYVRRTDAGERIDITEFRSRFPEFPDSVGRLLSACELLLKNLVDPERETVVIWPRPGDTFLGFALKAELGQGAFARVYLAEELALGQRSVAVKIARHGTAEAATLGRLSHPGIVPVHSVRQEPDVGLTVVCMPYAGVATLKNVLDQLFVGGKPAQSAQVILETARAARPNLPPPEEQQPLVPEAFRGSSVDAVLRIGLQLAEALAHAHAQGVCHGDVKPSNVLLTPSGRPMLLDFNLAFDDRDPDQPHGGTPAYMAPEQLRRLGMPSGQTTGPLDPRSDLFSLGIILYELLTGRLPFGPAVIAPTGQEVCRRVLEQQQRCRVPLRSVNPDVNPRIASVIESCLALDVDQRPANATELVRLLRQLLSSRQQATRWEARHRTGLTVAVLGLLLGGVVASYGLNLRAPASVREYQQGLQAYHQGDYYQAIQRFDEATKGDPALAEAYFVRGQAYLQMKEPLLALRDFQQAHRLAPSGQTLACMGYCHAEKKYYAGAAVEFNKAIESGLVTAEVLNNLGYCYLQDGRELPEAQKCLNRAATLDPGLAAVWHNLVILDYRLTLRDPSKTPPKGWEMHVQEALNRCPRNADLHTDIAKLYAAGSRRDSRWVTQAAQHREAAAALGRPLVNLAKDSVLSESKLEVRTTRALAPTPAQQPLPRSVRLVNPIRESGSTMATR